jgi:hypothetical protein
MKIILNAEGPTNSNSDSPFVIIPGGRAIGNEMPGRLAEEEINRSTNRMHIRTAESFRGPNYNDSL